MGTEGVENIVNLESANVDSSSLSLEDVVPETNAEAGYI